MDNWTGFVPTCLMPFFSVSKQWRNWQSITRPHPYIIHQLTSEAVDIALQGITFMGKLGLLPLLGWKMSNGQSVTMPYVSEW